MARSEIPFIVQDTDGTVIEGASADINHRGGGGATATIYAEETGSSVLNNPVATDNSGRIPGWLDEGSYSVAISGDGIVTYVRALEIVRGDAIYDSAKLADGAVVSSKLASSAVTTIKIGAEQVTESKLSDDAVSTRTIASNAITTSKINNSAVDNSKLATNAVTNSKIQNGSVDNSKLSDSSVTNSKISNGTVTEEKLANNTLSSSKFTSSVVQRLIPTGTILPFGGSSPPSGFLLCNGAEHSRTTYNDLFGVVGTDWGAGNGSTTFNVPDCRGRNLVGLGSHAEVNALGKTEGAALSNRRPNHSHTVNSHSHTISHSHGYSGSTSIGGNHAHSLPSQYTTGDIVMSGVIGSQLQNLSGGDTQVDHRHRADGWITNHAGAHSHSFSGTTGGASTSNSGNVAPGTNEQGPAYGVVNYIIKT